MNNLTCNSQCTKTFYQNNFKYVAFLFTFFYGYRQQKSSCVSSSIGEKTTSTLREINSNLKERAMLQTDVYDTADLYHAK